MGRPGFVSKDAGLVKHLILGPNIKNRIFEGSV
jgi:hypothetical protein